MRVGRDRPRTRPDVRLGSPRSPGENAPPARGAGPGSRRGDELRRSPNAQLPGRFANQCGRDTGASPEGAAEEGPAVEPVSHFRREPQAYLTLPWLPRAWLVSWRRRFPMLATESMRHLPGSQVRRLALRPSVPPRWRPAPLQREPVRHSDDQPVEACRVAQPLVRELPTPQPASTQRACR